jgi:hypothetical protein
MTEEKFHPKPTFSHINDNGYERGHFGHGTTLQDNGVPDKCHG